MFEILLAIGIGWLAITLVGHASWVIVAKFFSLFTSSTETASTNSLDHNAVAKSVIQNLHQEGRIDGSTLDILVSAINANASRTPLQLLRREDTSLTSASNNSESSNTPDTDSQINGDLKKNLGNETVEPKIFMATLVNDLDPTLPVEHLAESDALAPSTLRQTPQTLSGLSGRHTPDNNDERPSQASPSQPSPQATKSTRPTPQPTVSTSEIIQSFLSAHNIRWGELIAGTLIVVCSIGLVISLWGSLVETHRAIPTLIFLAANAAIYSVGLYTLSRWRLRHTSRAVLVIATLLIPLSVLAGIAASGINPSQAIDLSDPITLVTIGLAGIIYSVFLYMGGKALTSRTHAWAIFTSVAGSIIALVFAPAAIRAFENQAGWLNAIASSSAVFSCAMIGKLHHRKSTTLGPAAARIHLLVMGLSAYSLAIAALAMGYHLRGFDTQAWLPLAITSIPACLALAGVASFLRERSRSSTISMIGAVCCVLLFTITLIIFAPAMLSPTWLWTWALTISISLIAGRHLFQQPSWFAISTLPVGLVATCTAQIWLGDQTWQTSALWTRFINGEAMIASLLMCLATGSLWWTLTQGPAKKWLQYANIGWFSATLLIAAVLSFSSEARMGIVPTWVVTVTLFTAVFTSFLFSLKDYRVCYLTAGTTALAFNSIYQLQLSFSLDNLPIGIYLSLSIAGLLTVFSESSYRLAKRFFSDCSDNALLVRKELATLSFVAVIVATILAFIGGRAYFEISCATHVISTLTLIWISLLLGKLNIFKIAQLPTFLLTLSLTYHYFEPELWTKASWLSGNAMWGWATAFGALAVFWYLTREAITLYLTHFVDQTAPSENSAETSLPTFLKDRLIHLFGRPIPPLQMPDSWFGLTATGLTTVATTYLFGCLNRSTIAQLPLDYDTSWLLPTLGWLSVGLFTVLFARQKEQKEVTSTIIGLFGILAILWFSCQLTASILSDPKTILIASVSLATTVMISTKTALRYTKSSILSPYLVTGCNATQCLILITGSISLLYSGILVPVAQSQLADTTCAVSISAWWFVVSMLALWQSNSTGKSWTLILSVLFFAAAGTVLATAFVVQTSLVQTQVACLLTFIWLLIASRVLAQKADTADDHHQSNPLHGILQLLISTGIITSVVSTAIILLSFRTFYDLFSPAGFALSLIAAVNLSSSRVQRFFCGTSISNWTISAPFSISLLAGQIAWFLSELNLTNGSLGNPQSFEIISGIWLLAAIASMLIPGRRQQAVDFYHMAGVTLITLAAAVFYAGKSDLLPWISLIATVTSGVQITLMSMGKKEPKVPAFAARGLGWMVGVSGIVLPWQFTDFGASYSILWLTFWILAWRYICRDRIGADGESKRMYHIPALDFSAVLFSVSFVDLTHGLGFLDATYSLDNPMLWMRCTCYALAAASVVLRPRTHAEWFMSITMICTAFSLLGIAITDMLDGSFSHKYTVTLISYAFFLVVMTSSLGNLAKLTSWITSSPADVHFKRLVSTIISILATFAVVSVSSPIFMMIGRIPLHEVQIAIAGIAMTAWAFTELSEQASISKLRYVAVYLGLAAIALWASASSLDNEYFLLTACMRWLVASALVIPTLLFVLPKLLGASIRNRWLDALKKGAAATGLTALCSTFAMISLEFMLHDNNGLDNLSLVAVIGAAVTLGALSLMCGATALATGPQGYLRSTLSISDQKRIYLVLATQLLGFLTWLHVFLCKPSWAFAGLNEHWPYVVMGLSFLSVGITEFARRRGDAVMAATIRKTSLYLPLIPMLGLWLSASSQGNSILTNMLNSNYEILLIIAALYYFAIGSMWKATMPRVTGVILGNAAWWFVLVQMPGWGFMMHPQLWLIPPAVCVLAMTHIYRDRLDSQLASGIRYASTLLIYISSSADMLLQQIGTTLAGPIILILLALVGMLLGVILRIRPFLYLGAAFVFLGVTSMVWHANRAFESTWPWWVFGIGMGIILLAGLMMLEKFKPQLQAYAKNLSTWEA